MDPFYSNNSNSLCNTSKIILNRYELRIIYYTQCIFGLLALFPNILTLNLLWHVKIFHANLRIIMVNLTCNLLIYSVTLTYKAFGRLTGDPCNFPMLIQPCAIQELAMLIPLHNALMSVVILSLERLYATIRYRSYDYAKSTPYLGIFLLACSWATTIALNVPGVFYSPPNIWVAVCDAALVGSSSGVAKTLITLLVFESVAFGITTFVFFYNRYISNHMVINRAVYNLSARFQVNQNVQLNKALMPGIILHVLGHIPTYVFLCAIFLGGNMEMSTKAWLLQLTYAWRLIYALFDPIILIGLNSNLRQGLEKSAIGRLFLFICHRFCKRNLTKTSDINQETTKIMNAHFDYLQQMWTVQGHSGSKARK